MSLCEIRRKLDGPVSCRPGPVHHLARVAADEIGVGVQRVGRLTLCAQQFGQLAGIDPIVLVLATVDRPEIERVGQYEFDPGIGAGVGDRRTGPPVDERSIDRQPRKAVHRTLGDLVRASQDNDRELRPAPLAWVGGSTR